MKLKFNINSLNLLKFLYIHGILYTKNIYQRSSIGHNRSTLLDFPTIYPSESKIGNLGR